VIDMTDIICVTCGQSSVPGAPRRLDEWNDAGHTDSAHLPAWSQESFAGSEWAAHPQRALWYACVVVGRTISGGTETDYFYGYADCEDPPDVALLVPAGWDLLESEVTLTPRNPLWVADDDD
jgi:hypothetical protein